MKLAALALVASLGLGGLASADSAPTGNRAPFASPTPSIAPPPSADADPSNAQFRQLLLSRFDRDHNGQLDADERHRAIRALRRIARRMASEERAAGYPGGKPVDPAAQKARMQRLIERLDRNHDGVVSPDEMPPGVARRLPALDRNGDGSLDARDAR